MQAAEVEYQKLKSMNTWSPISKESIKNKQILPLK
jgi:hypothetical protein